MNWTWDPDKNRINRDKHKVSFETEQLAFEDPLALMRPDPYPYEPRWQTVGTVKRRGIFDMTDQQKAELAALAAMSEDEIDTTDIPEVPMDWSKAKRGVFYRLNKQRITLDLDADVIAWFKSNAKTDIDCQTGINQVLREHVRREKARNSTTT